MPSRIRLYDAAGIIPMPDERSYNSPREREPAWKLRRRVLAERQMLAERERARLAAVREGKAFADDG
jgi:hypothetical protein